MSDQPTDPSNLLIARLGGARRHSRLFPLVRRHRKRNGVGKTTAVRILATLIKPDEGRANVCGYDVVRDAHQVRQLIGLTGQCTSVDEGCRGPTTSS